jgi:hypothetical protein
VSLLGWFSCGDTRSGCGVRAVFGAQVARWGRKKREARASSTWDLQSSGACGGGGSIGAAAVVLSGDSRRRM